MLKLTIQGMSCSHCSAAVSSALREVPGVTEVAVDLAAGQATVDGSASLELLVAAVEDAGYTAAAAPA